MGAPWRDETDEERAKEQAIVDAFYDAFVGRVAKSRRLDEERVRTLATGEIWLGEEAKKLGLVDEIGDLEAQSSWRPTPRASRPARRPSGSGGRSSSEFRGTLQRLAAAVADEIEARLESRLRT